MKRTVKVWMAAVMSGVLLAGGAAMTGQAPWGMEAQAHSGRTDATSPGADSDTGPGSIPMECVPMQEAGKVPRPRPGPRQKHRHKPRSRHRPRLRHKPRRRLRHRTRQRSGQLPGQDKLPVLRAGIRMGHTGTISARTEPV